LFLEFLAADASLDTVCCQPSTYTIISIDYRLAPQAKLSQILQDLDDAYRWVRGEGPKLFRIDPNRIAVVGHSAGGYLALTSGFRLNPRPTAVVSFYGYGDIAAEWYSRGPTRFITGSLRSRRKRPTKLSARGSFPTTWARTEADSTFTPANKAFGQWKWLGMTQTRNQEFLIRSVPFGMSPRIIHRRYFFMGTRTQTFRSTNLF